MKKIKLEDCTSEADLYQYRKQQEDKIEWGVLLFWVAAAFFVAGFFYLSFKSFYWIYKALDYLL